MTTQYAVGIDIAIGHDRVAVVLARNINGVTHVEGSHTGSTLAVAWAWAIKEATDGLPWYKRWWRIRQWTKHLLGGN